MSTETFGLLPYIYLFLYLSPNVKAYQLGFCGSRLLRAVVSSPKHSVKYQQGQQRAIQTHPFPDIFWELPIASLQPSAAG